MSDTNDIISILNAINEINNKTKKKNLNKLTVQNPVSGLSENLNLPPDVDRLISEAEKYKKLLDASPKVTPVQRQPKSPLDEDALILTDEVLP